MQRLRLHIPRQSGLSTFFDGAGAGVDDPVADCHQVSASKSRGGISEVGKARTLGGGARSNHERRSLFACAEIQGREFPEFRSHEADIEIP